MQDIKIEPRTPIETLRKAGVVPDWMAKDYEIIHAALAAIAVYKRHTEIILS